MYLSRSQVQTLLNSPYYKQPVTKSIFDYTLYRGKLNVRVITVRFNLNEKDPINSKLILSQLVAVLSSEFSMGTHLLGSINYDLLLVDPKSNPKSYYIWRANSNASNFQQENETHVVFSYDNLYRFVNKAAQIHVPDIEINFANSNIDIDRILTIVFSFMKI